MTRLGKRIAERARDSRGAPQERYGFREDQVGDFSHRLRQEWLIATSADNLSGLLRVSYAIVLAPSDTALQQLRQRGLKFDVLAEFKDYGSYTTASSGAAMLINQAPHPNAATLFLNWVLGREGMAAWSKAMNHAVQRLDVPTDHLPPYVVPKPGVKYWISDSEENVLRSAEEEKILKELFGR